MTALLKFLMLLSVVEATKLTPLPRKVVQRILLDDPIPDGWRLATINDAISNKASFNNLLNPDDAARLCDGKIRCISFGKVKIESGTKLDQILRFTIIVNFEPGYILRSEEWNRVNIIRAKCLAPLIVLGWLSWAFFALQNGIESLPAVGYVSTFLCGLFFDVSTHGAIMFVSFCQILSMIENSWSPSFQTQLTAILTLAWARWFNYIIKSTSEYKLGYIME